MSHLPYIVPAYTLAVVAAAVLALTARRRLIAARATLARLKS